MLKKYLLAATLSIFPLFGLHQGMMNISDLDLEVRLSLDAGQFQDGYAIDTYFFGGSFLSTEDGEGDYLYDAHLMVINDLPDSENVRVGVGMKYVTTPRAGLSYRAMPVGGTFISRLKNEKDLPAFFSVTVYYAPGSLSFADARSYFEVRAGLGYELIENVKAFVEWRSIRTNYETEEYLFNQTLYGGMTIGF